MDSKLKLSSYYYATKRKMKEKEREIWIGRNRLYFGEDNIIYITSIKEQDEEVATATKEATLKIVNMTTGKLDVIVDLNKSGKASPEARKIWKELNEHPRVGKVAFFGLHPVAGVLASFVMGLSKNKDMRFFKKGEEALEWLKGDSF